MKRINFVAGIKMAGVHALLMGAKMDKDIKEALKKRLNSPKIYKKFKELNKKTNTKKIFLWNDHFVSDLVVGGCVHPILGVFDPNCGHCRSLKLRNTPLTNL